METATVTRHVPSDHPAFAGHFPGQPLWPGVLLLAQVMEAARGQPELSARMARGTLTQAKFLAPVRPDTPLSIVLQWDDAGLHFEIRTPAALACRGAWRW
jgi:3-hydroxymyristoyl/3-hydroxydecanoyl-(acyl carrier protein) dehydratase